MSRTTFGDYLNTHSEEAGFKQTEVAAWLNDWMTSEDIDAELERMVRDAPSPERRARIEDVVKIIRDFLDRKPNTASFHVSQAAVSKWRQKRKGPGHGSAPTPEKWPAIARYLGLYLDEVYDMIVKEQQPVTAAALRRQLTIREAENDELRRMLESKAEEVDALDARLDRAERALALAEATQDSLESRIKELSELLADSTNGVGVGV